MERLPTPAFLPGVSHGQRSRVGYISRGPRESDTTEQLTVPHFHTVGVLSHVPDAGGWAVPSGESTGVRGAWLQE